MVRKVSILLIVIAVLQLAVPRAQAASYTAFEGNLNSTYVGYFRDIVNGQVGSDYVVWRNGQNEYCMMLGQLDLDGSKLSGSGKIYSYRQDDFGMMAGQDFIYSVVSDESFVLDLGDEYAYCSLGDYPRLIDERGEIHEIVQTFMLCVLFIYIVLHHILRSGRS